METTKKNEGRAGQTLKAETLKAEGGAERGDRLLTKQEMADRLQVDLRTVERWTAMGVLQPLRVLGVVRFDWEEELQRLKAEFGGEKLEPETGVKPDGANIEHRTSDIQPPLRSRAAEGRRA